MTADLEQVTRLQTLDGKIAELQREVAALPKHIAEIEKALESHLRRLESDRAALTANQKDRKRFEDDIKVHEQKISKLRDQMQQAKTNEQYRAFQHEIDYAEKEVRKAEDRILELMQQSEPLDANVKRAEAALKEEKTQVDSEKAVACERTAVDEKELAELQAERKEIAALVQPQVYQAYERVRKRRHGNVVVECVDGRCGACQIALRPQFYQDLRRGDQVMFCESCGRILYYNRPVSFEHEVSPTGAHVHISRH